METKKNMAMYLDRLDDLQTSVDEALSVLSLILEDIEREDTETAMMDGNAKVVYAAAMMNRVRDTYVPSLRMIERHLTAANETAEDALEEPQQ